MRGGGGVFYILLDNIIFRTIYCCRPCLLRTLASARQTSSFHPSYHLPGLILVHSILLIIFQVLFQFIPSFLSFSWSYSSSFHPYLLSGLILVHSIVLLIFQVLFQFIPSFLSFSRSYSSSFHPYLLSGRILVHSIVLIIFQVLFQFIPSFLSSSRSYSSSFYPSYHFQGLILVHSILLLICPVLIYRILIHSPFLSFRCQKFLPQLILSFFIYILFLETHNQLIWLNFFQFFINFTQ